MYPEDRVLVGVINRKKDFTIAQKEHWYRIPQGKAEKGITFEYVAFFFSGRAFKDQGSAIRYYARRTGSELATRAQLLPHEPNHKHADKIYHKLQFSELKAKVPPIENPSKRRFAFIYTTWDRFIGASTIDDLYSKADHLVDRVFYALLDAGYKPQRRWENEYPTQAPQVRVLCEHGEVIASTFIDDGIPIRDDITQSVADIRQAVDKLGGPKLVRLPLD